MSKSQRLRETDVRSMLRLMGEIGELPRDRRVRTAHMLAGLCRLTGARAGTVTLARHSYDSRGRRRINVIDGQMLGVDDRGLAVIAEYLQTLEPADPLSEPLYSATGELVVRGREQLMESGAWHRSAHFNEVRRGFGVDDCIEAKVLVPGSSPRQPQVQTVCIHRALRDRRFGARHWRMVELFLDEARRFVLLPPSSVPSTHPAPTSRAPGGPEVQRLPPRLRDVLGCLVRGEATKQVARHLGLSVHTVNGYIKDLYRRFDVNTRGELLALFIRQ